MSWRETTLGELLTVKHGWAFKSEFFEDHGPLVVVTPGNFFEEGGFKLRPGKDRSYSGKFGREYLLNEGDLIVAMTEQGPGLLGSTAMIPEANRFLHNQRIGLVSPKYGQEVCLKFLYNLFNTAAIRGQISGSASGTKVRHTAPERIYRVKARIPNLPTQTRIASVLSAYDDLIENNRRRIGLLEKAARLLYREWFVNFRFPGFESGKFVGGLPEGWKKITLGEKAEIRKGRNITKETVSEGAIPVVAGGLKPAYFHNAANVKGPVITISASGANAGHVSMYFQDIWASDCSFISGNENPKLFFIHQTLLQNLTSIRAMQKGAAQPHVYPKDLQRLVVVWPAEEVVDQFSKLTEPQYWQIQVLTKQNAQLTRARDLILPRLMDGRIPV